MSPQAIPDHEVDIDIPDEEVIPDSEVMMDALRTPPPQAQGSWFDRNIMDTMPVVGGVRTAARGVRDWAGKKAEELAHKDLVRGKSSLLNRVGEFGLRSASDAASLVNDLTSAQSVGTSIGAAAVPEVVLPYLAYQGTEQALTPRQQGESSPDAIRRRLMAGAQVAGTVAGATTGPQTLTGRTASTVGRIARGGEAGADAAALKGLHVSSRSPKAVKALEGVEGARPYLQGAKSQLDIQKKLPPSKAEVWTPYQDAVQQRGHVIVNGPDGPASVAALEKLRTETSAQLDGVRRMAPSDKETVLQKNQLIAELERKDHAIKSAIDPELRKTGIDPGLIRNTYGSLKEVERRVKGKTTIAEPAKPMGFGKMADIKIDKPRTWLGKPLEGARDVLAGRPWWKGKATDINIKEGFRTGGTKPNLKPYPFQPVQMPAGATNPIRGMLPPPRPGTATNPITTPYPNPETSGIIPGTLSRELSKHGIVPPVSMTSELARKIETALKSPKYRDMFADEQKSFIRNLLGMKGKQ